MALCLPRSPSLIISLLGVLKAGAAYLPLDPAHPPQRNGFILVDANARAIITDREMRARLPRTKLSTLLFEELGDSPVEASAPDLGVESTGQSLAYVIYTSGSTGEPKGVAVPHRALTNLLLSMREQPGLSNSDTLLAVTTICFDIAGLELFLPLIVGARVVIGTRETATSGERLMAELARSGVTAMQATPGTWRLLLEAGWRGGQHVKVMCGGESLDRDLADILLERCGSVWNLYGPTETTIWSTLYRMQPGCGVVPIGRPIRNTRVYILDERLQLVPVGEKGELYLGGTGVARGYVGRPELTAERFLPDPFTTEPGARMYRTGDRARWRADGTLEFLGRIDSQAKIRGFRIELGEIEKALQGLGSIRQSIVVAHEVCPGDTRLIAYLLGGHEISEESLRSELSKLLPEYMVPSAFVRLESLPLTTSGKVDRKALPVPKLGRSDDTAYEAPRTRIEENIAAIWSELLGVERIGIHDDFFRLGGHSLLAARFVGRAAAAGFEISVRALFKNPTIAALAALISTQRAPLAWAPIERLPDHAVLPASFAQQRLWFIDQLEGPGLSAYNISTATRLEGALSVEALNQALDDLVLRHEPLRTTFAVQDGELVQIIQAAFPIDLPADDLRHLAEPERAAEAERLAGIEADRPFDMSNGPLLRARVLRTGEAEHILLLTVHHVAADGWSLGVLWRELGDAYRARLAGHAPVFPALPIRYVDYASWQRREVITERFAHSRACWRDRLTGLEDLDLPTDRARPAVLSYRGARHDFTLSGAVVERMRGVCAQTGTTPHMALLAAFQAVLGRLAGREDLAVGVPVAGRPRPELEGLIGLFVNTLVLRADLSGNPSYREFLNRTRNVSLDAHEHEAVPFERLVEELQPQRQRNRNPFVQVMFQHNDAADLEALAPEIATTEFPEPVSRVRFDLELQMRLDGRELTGSLYYSTDLFDLVTIERLASRLEMFLETALAAPEAPLSEISLVGKAELELLQQWNDTAVAFAGEATVHAVFREQAARTPAATALLFGDDRLTYAELDCRSDHLAAQLRAQGVGTETVVALCLPRSPGQIISLLGILKAGAAYLPLDPANPPQRNGYILGDARAQVIITDRKMRAKLPATDLCTLLIEEMDNSLVEASTLDFAIESTGQSLAYVIYTSGSTGEPKGVMVEHRSIMRLMHGQSYVSFAADRVFLQMVPVAFDASTFEIWGSLLRGATLVIAPEGPLDLAQIGGLIATHRVTTLWLTAGLFNEIVDARPEILHGVCEIVTGGEALSPRHVREAHERLGPETEIINGYGPTECTTFACCQRIPRENSALGGTVPIGRPIGNTRAYVLDDGGRLAPIGVAGELHLGGTGVARGYLGRPDLTAERFLPDPFSPQPDARMYRTGDRARWRADGTLEFLGRLDTQVKIRGFRIELGEIEAALGEIPTIRQAMVVAHAIDAGDTRLVAYIVADAIDSDVIRTSLALKLPEYMIPSVFVRLDEFPLTARGKVDRKALPAPQLGRSDHREYEAPRTPLEETIAAIWRELLGVERIGSAR